MRVLDNTLGGAVKHELLYRSPMGEEDEVVESKCQARLFRDLFATAETESVWFQAHSRAFYHD
jgi:hypothetical protein